MAESGSLRMGGGVCVLVRYQFDFRVHRCLAVPPFQQTEPFKTLQSLNALSWPGTPSTMNTTCYSLIQRVQTKSDRISWNEFFAVYHPYLVRFVESRGLAGADVSDVVQNIFIRLMNALGGPVTNKKRDDFEVGCGGLPNVESSTGIVSENVAEKLPWNSCPPKTTTLALMPSIGKRNTGSTC